MRIFYFFIVFIAAQSSYGQWFNNISTFTTQDGLSNNTIACLQKDEAGFLWIGTHEGLNRYDGTEFINVLSNAKNDLPSNNITRICFISKTILAVGTDAGLCFLNTVTLTAQKIELPFYKEFSNTGYYIEDLLYKKDTKELWVATWHGIFVINEAGKLQKQLMPAKTSMQNGCFARKLLMDKQRNVYFFSQQGNMFYYPDFQKHVQVPVENSLAGFVLNDMIKKGFYLMSVEMLDHESLCIFSRKGATDYEEYLSYSNIITGRNFTNKLSVDFPYEKRMSNAFPLNDSVFLVNSYFGEPLLYNTNDHKMHKAADHPLWFTSWPDGFITTFLKDGNNMWIGTSKGLLQSPLKTDYFKNNSQLVNKINESGGLVSFNYGIYDNNKLWLGCMGAGVFGLDTIKKSLQVVFDKIPDPALGGKMVTTDLVTTGKALWVYSVYGPAEINTQTKQISLVNAFNKDSAFDAFASYPMKDSKGNIWSSLPNGVCSYSIANNTFTNYKTKYQGGNFPLLRAGPKTEDATGNIWMTRQDTLIKFDVNKQTFSTFFINKNGRALRPVTNIASDQEDVLYMAVAGSFAMYHISTGSVDVFTKQTGIISTAINNIVCDKQGNAWIATEGGLVFYNKQKKKFSSFTKADGLPDDNVINVNFTDETKKILFIGFSKSYSLFEPGNFLLEKIVPQNVITRIEVNGESIIADANQKLSYKQNNISFTYTGINFNQGQQNNYACMLEPVDQDWKYPGTERKINYINLPPGKYTFKIKSANHQGEWNEEPAIFTFEITPPFWQQWWFRALLICIVVFSIYYFIKRREASIQKENNIKLQMSELRMQALRAQMNPHFIFNSLNSIQNYILSNNTIDAAGYLSKFAKLMRRILDQSKHNFLPLGEVMETLKMYVEIEAFRFNNEFTYTFNVEEDDELLDARVPPMMLQPFVENAILHGLMPKNGDKKLLIACRIINKHIEIVIDDNGIGRIKQQPKAGHESQGEKLTAGMLDSLQQIQNIKASIEIIDKKENEQPAGTTIKLTIALK